MLNPANPGVCPTCPCIVGGCPCLRGRTTVYPPQRPQPILPYGCLRCVVGPCPQYRIACLTLNPCTANEANYVPAIGIM